MSGWHAVVPIKPLAARKTRLQSHLTPDKIEVLTEGMLQHVLAVVGSVGAIEAVTLLASEPHPGWHGDWFADLGLGLNAALGAVGRAAPQRMIVLHADLPALEAADVEALIEAASEAGAIAPDHRGSGTNALALLNARDFPFCFGPDSFARHCALLPGCGTVRRPGLARDIDLPEDLPWAAALGCLPSSL